MFEQVQEVKVVEKLLQAALVLQVGGSLGAETALVQVEGWQQAGVGLLEMGSLKAGTASSMRFHVCRRRR